MPEGRRDSQRERELLGRLFEAHSARIYNYVAKLIGDRDEAEDVLQEAFVRASAKLGRGTEERARRWLYRVATNLAIDRLRRRRFRMISMDSGPGEARLTDLVESRSAGPEAALEGAEMRESLAAAVEGLPTEQRQVIVLRHMSGLSFKEISKVTGWPLGTVLSRMHRALERLKAAVGERYGFSDDAKKE